MTKSIKILGIESSCDETSASIIEDDKVLSLIIHSQIETHKQYGGVVPEISARAHLNAIEATISQALDDANLDISDLDAVCATAGPGLIGGVIVGTMAAKTIAMTQKIPYIAINHLEGHALTARLSDKVPFPYLLILMSGGHCQIYIIHALQNYEKLGGTIDDSIGEAIDKTARLLGLDYPGGPIVEKLALNGDPKSFTFPQPLVREKNCNFSFSGLKTAAKYKIDELKKAGTLEENISNICASFQYTIGEVLAKKCQFAIDQFKARYPEAQHVVISGGVAANQCFRSKLTTLCDKNTLIFTAPPMHLCTDNAAMIAWAGMEHYLAGQFSDLDFAPRPRWPLDEISSPSH